MHLLYSLNLKIVADHFNPLIIAEDGVWTKKIPVKIVLVFQNKKKIDLRGHHSDECHMFYLTGRPS